MKKHIHVLKILIIFFFIGTTAWGQVNERSEWLRAGFSSHETDRWSGLDFNLPEAQNWLQAGFDPYEAHLWKKHNVSLEEAKEWNNISKNFIGRIPSSQVEEWINAAHTSKEFQVWLSSSVTNYYEVEDLKAAGFDSDEAQKWHSLGIPHDNWLQYKKAGIDYPEARKWANAGVKRISDVDHFIAKGFSYDIPPQWASLGINDLKDIEFLLDRGIGFDEAKLWKESGLSALDEWADWKASNITAAQAKEWIDAGFTDLYLIDDLNRDGIKTAKEYVARQETIRHQKSIDEITNKIFLAIFIIISIATAYSVILGLADQVLFYENEMSVVQCFYPFLAAIGGSILAFLIGNFLVENEFITIFLMVLVAIITLYFCIDIFRESILQNGGKKLTGSCVAVGKISLSFLCLVFFNRMTNWDEKKSSGKNRADRLNAAILLGITVYAIKKLINGERYKQKFQRQSLEEGQESA